MEPVFFKKPASVPSGSGAVWDVGSFAAPRIRQLVPLGL